MTKTSEDPGKLLPFERAMTALADIALEHRILALLLAMSLITPMVWRTATHFGRQDNSFDVWFEADDPDYQLYRQFKDEFESDELVAVAIVGSKQLDRLQLEAQRELVQQLRTVPNLREVSSIFTTSVIENSAGELVIAPPFSLDEPLTPEVIERGRARIDRGLRFVGHLLSPERDAVLILGRLQADLSHPIKATLIHTIETILSDFKTRRPGSITHFTGTPVMDITVDKLACSDQQRFFPVVLLVSALLFLLIFRHFGLMLVPFSVQLAVIFSTIGGYYWFHPTSNMVFAMVVPIVLAVTIGDSIHILHRFRTLYRGCEFRSTLLCAVAEEARPCFYTSITTAAGFFSFLTSEVAPIRNLGLFAGLGSLLAYLLTIVYIPVLLSLLPKQWIPCNYAQRITTPAMGTSVHILRSTTDWTLRHQGLVLAITLGILVVACVGITRVRIEVSAMEFLHQDHPVREGLRQIQDRITGLGNVEVMLRGEEDSAKDPHLVGAIAAFQAEVETQPRVTGTTSYIDYLAAIHRSLGDLDLEDQPPTREQTAQYLLLAETAGDQDLPRYVNHDYSTARISTRLRLSVSQTYREGLSRIRASMQRWFGESGARVTGLVPMYRKLDELLLRSQTTSLLVAFGMVFLFLWGLTRQVGLAALAMVPNILPIALTVGLMGYLHIPIDPGTVLMGGIALGIVVDDTIHYLNHFSLELRRHGEYPLAARNTATKVGPAIVATSLVLMSGFLVLVLGSFNPTTNFGLLSALTMLFALPGDLVLLPLLLILFKPFRKQ